MDKMISQLACYKPAAWLPLDTFTLAFPTKAQVGPSEKATSEQVGLRGWRALVKPREPAGLAPAAGHTVGVSAWVPAPDISNMG